MDGIYRLAACAMLGMVASSAAQADPGMDPASSKGCMACHQVDTKRVGPPLRGVAERYAGEPRALDYLSDKIRHGSRGDWGAVPMPAQSQVSDAEARDLVNWVLSLSPAAR